MTLEPIKIDYVLHPQAVALKELGFNEPCLFSFYHNGETIDSIYADLCNYNAGNLISAPTYSQAFRFFREKYKLYHDIKMFGDWDEPQYSYIISGKSMSNPAHMWYYKDVNSYPEAELACLRKLIEIVKNKTL